MSTFSWLHRKKTEKYKRQNEEKTELKEMRNRERNTMKTKKLKNTSTEKCSAEVKSNAGVHLYNVWQKFDGESF